MYADNVSASAARAVESTRVDAVVTLFAACALLAGLLVMCGAILDRWRARAWASEWSAIAPPNGAVSAAEGARGLTTA
ncbi:hypothetical protein GCM10010171_22240 [Actinokineospora fastidiosa]|uniref:Uncharacterized protein n=1 Tax=Actinokineospora fastidiosa TaxID=1816 RepID=A0A918GC79_9PSEU|nr:hypothetical protein GCM10010171_22240 [Actinokineospora fastidiosa]